MKFILEDSSLVWAMSPDMVPIIVLHNSSLILDFGYSCCFCECALPVHSGTMFLCVWVALFIVTMLILDVVDFSLLIDAIIDISWESDAWLIRGRINQRVLLLRAVGHELLETVSLIWLLLHFWHSVTHLFFEVDYRAQKHVRYELCKRRLTILLNVRSS